MRKIVIIFIAILFAFMCVTTLFTPRAYASTNGEGIDVVVLLDLSGSMTANDSERLSILATHILIDKLDKQNDRIAIIGFNGSIKTVCGSSLQGPLNEYTTSQMHQELDNLIFDGHTDYGIALLEATSILEKESFNNGLRKPLVILLADGWIDINKNTGKTDEMSIEEVSNATDILNQYGCPLYTIGLTDNEEYIDFLEKYSTKTNGDFQLVEKSSDIPMLLSNVLSDFRQETVQLHRDVQVSSDVWEDIDYEIKDEYVSSTDITMVTDAVIEYRLLDPSDTPIDFDTSPDSYTYSTNKYTSIKVLEPQKGDWKLQVKLKNGANSKKAVTISYVHSYDLDAKLACFDGNDAKVNVMNIGDDYVLKAELLNKGVPVTDKSVYTDVMDVVLYIKESGQADDDSMEHLMIYNGSEYEFDFAPTTPGTYEMWGVIHHNNFIRETQRLSINIIAVQPTQTNIPTSTNQSGSNTKNKLNLKLLLWILGGLLLILGLAGILINQYLKAGKLFFAKKRPLRFQCTLHCELEQKTNTRFECPIRCNKKVKYLSIKKLIQMAAKQEGKRTNTGAKKLLTVLKGKQKRELSKILLYGKYYDIACVESSKSDLTINGKTERGNYGSTEMQLKYIAGSELSIYGNGIKELRIRTK